MLNSWAFAPGVLHGQVWSDQMAQEVLHAVYGCAYVEFGDSSTLQGNDNGRPCFSKCQSSVRCDLTQLMSQTPGLPCQLGPERVVVHHAHVTTSGTIRNTSRAISVGGIRNTSRAIRVGGSRDTIGTIWYTSGTICVNGCRTTNRTLGIGNNRDTSGPTDQLTDRLTDRPTERSTDRPTVRTSDRPTDRTTARLIDRPTVRPIF